MDGLAIGPSASKCEVFYCEVYHNAREGISVVDGSKCVTLARNEVYGNDKDGVFVRHSEVNITENKLFDNEYWGIWTQDNSRCTVSMNDVFRNKCGGVCVERRWSSSVNFNTSHDNIGPGYIEKDNALFLNQSNSNGLLESNSEYNNKELTAANGTSFLSSWCSACSKRCQDLKWCSTCLTAGYCNQDCQKNYSIKHKRLCKMFREKSSFLIPNLVSDGSMDGLSNNFHPKSLEDVGPKYANHPRKTARKFVVKVRHCCYDKDRTPPMAMLGIYDRSLDVYGLFQSEFIDRLIKEFGVLCQCKVAEKEFFFTVYLKRTENFDCLPVISLIFRSFELPC